MSYEKGLKPSWDENTIKKTIGYEHTEAIEMAKKVAWKEGWEIGWKIGWKEGREQIIYVVVRNILSSQKIYSKRSCKFCAGFRNICM